MTWRIGVEDDFTVHINLDRPWPLMSQALATPAFAIPLGPPNVDEFGRPVVGTGPFKFEQWEPGQPLVLSRNTN